MTKKHNGNLDIYGVLTLGADISASQYTMPKYKGEDGDSIIFVNGEAIFTNPAPYIDIAQTSGGVQLVEDVAFILSSINDISGSIDTFSELLDTPKPASSIDSHEGEIIIVNPNASMAAQKVSYSGVTIEDIFNYVDAVSGSIQGLIDQSTPNIGSYVSSVNNISGGINILPGSGIEVSTAANGQITISSISGGPFVKVAGDSMAGTLILSGVTNSPGGAGKLNEAFGVNALASASLGTSNSNTAVGANAISGSTDSYWNVAIGYDAMKNNKTGSFNTVVGTLSMRDADPTKGYNVAVGMQTLQNVKSEYNTALGYRSLINLTTGEHNTSVGANANRYSTVGSKNTNVGYETLVGNISGSNNTAFGYKALGDATNASGNVGIGYEAGKNETTSNKLYIANSAGTSGQALIYGDFTSGKVYIKGSEILTSTTSIPSSATFNNYTLLSTTASISGDLQKQITLNGYPKAKNGYDQETIVLLGDSWTDMTMGRTDLEGFGVIPPSPNNISSFLVWGNALLNSRFRIIAEMGVSGDGLGGMYTRVVNGYDLSSIPSQSRDYNLPFTMPPLSTLKPDWLFIYGGINDITTGGDGQTIFNSWKNIYDYAVSIGVKVATATLPYVSLNYPSTIPWTASQKRHASFFNRLLRQFCKQNGVPCADFHNAYTDPVTEVLVDSYSDDELHPNYLGGIIGGVEFAKAFGQTNSIYQERLPPIRDSRRLNLNNRFIRSNPPGENGFWNLANNSDIDGPDGTYVFASDSSLQNKVFVSKVVRSDGYAGEVLRVNWDASVGATANSTRFTVTQEIREMAWSSGGQPNREVGVPFPYGNIFTNRIVTTTGRNASTPVDYLVTNFGGTFSTGSDPTATWSTTIGDTVTDGTVEMRVVYAIIPGVTTIRLKGVYSNHTLTSSGGSAVNAFITFKNSGGTGLGELNAFRFDGTYVPNMTNYVQSAILESPAMVVPANSSIYNLSFLVWTNPGTVGYIDLEAIDCYISEPEGSVP